MTLFSKLQAQVKIWLNKREPVSQTDWPVSQPESTPPDTTPIETSSATMMAVQKNLERLRSLLDAPKDSSGLETRLSKMREALGPGECHETVRQERWYPTVSCPYCASTEIKRLDTRNVASYHRYHCLVCHQEFGDESGSPLEKGVPPLQVWMQCWYLMGMSNSLAYIASQLNLDKSLVEQMMAQLQRFFQAAEPNSRNRFEENKPSQSLSFLNKIKREDTLANSERLDADVAHQPKDTAEFRRQQQKRRDPKNTKPPGSKL